MGVVEVVDLGAVKQGQAAEGAPGEDVSRVRGARLPDAQGDPPEVHEEVRAEEEAAQNGGEDVAEDDFGHLRVLGVDRDVHLLRLFLDWLRLCVYTCGVGCM